MVCLLINFVQCHGNSDGRVDVLGGNWPSPDELHLNRSQAEALKLALTNELAVIQGPPGTGKTHVGLKVMRILIENKRAWFVLY